MEKIQQLIQTNPNAKFIDLSFCQIENLEEIIYSLIRLRDLKEIHLSFNRLDSLPNDLSNFRKLEILDIKFNTFTDFENIIISLKTIPNLKELYIDCNDNEMNAIQKQIPNIEILNDRILKNNAIPKIRTNMLNSDMKNQNLNSLKKQIIDDSNNNKELNNLKEKDLIRNIINDLLIIIKNNFNNEHYKEFDSNKFLEELLEIKLNLEKVNNWKEYLKKIESVIKFITHNIKNILYKKDEKIGKLFDNYQQLNFAVFSSITSYKEFLHKEEFSFINPNYIPKFRPFDDREKLFHLKEFELSQEIKDVKNDNKVLLEILIKMNNKETNKLIEKLVEKYYKNENNDNLNLLKENKVNKPLNDYKNKKNNLNNKLNNVLEKKLTPKLIKENLTTVLKNKINNKQGRSETFEEYLYTYYNKTLGLKELVIENIASMITNLKENISKDFELVFWVKVLRNELDENFMMYLENLKQDVKSYVKYLIKITSDFNLKNRLNEIINFPKKDILLKSDCIKILNRFFKDFENCSDKNDFNDFYNNNCKRNNKSKLCLSYNKLLEFIIKKEYNKHINLIKPLFFNFKMADTKRNGYLFKDEFIKFLEILIAQNLGIKVDELTDLIDFEKSNNKITFSRLIEIFTSIKSHNYPDKNLIDCFKY